jgi:hypothetical protein
VALGQVFSEYFRFPCQSLFHQFLRNHPHLSSGAGTIGQQWPIAQIKKNADYSMMIVKAVFIKDHDMHQLMSVTLASGEDNIIYRVIVLSPVTVSAWSKA